ncbi:MAG: NAD(P)H-dependent oxidoreductase, partial [Planctomycetota bacterium]
MSYQPHIVVFAGSTRENSYNKRLAAIAAKGASETGADVKLIDLRDFPMPLFDQDLEAREGKNESAKQFKKLLVDCDGILIA